jgi:hypothetical protein
VVVEWDREHRIAVLILVVLLESHENLGLSEMKNDLGGGDRSHQSPSLSKYSVSEDYPPSQKMPCHEHQVYCGGDLDVNASKIDPSLYCLCLFAEAVTPPSPTVKN